jgi:hypothetical protein
MRGFAVKIPVTKTGEFDLAEQRRLAARFMDLRKEREKLKEAKEQLDAVFQRYVGAGGG